MHLHLIILILRGFIDFLMLGWSGSYSRR